MLRKDADLPAYRARKNLIYALGSGSYIVGVTKDPAQRKADNDAFPAGSDGRRAGWINLDGTPVPPEVWVNGQPGNDVGGYFVQVFNNGLDDAAAGVQRAAAWECCLVLPAAARTGKSRRD